MASQLRTKVGPILVGVVPTMNVIQIKSAQTHGLHLKELVVEGSKSRGLKQLHLTGLADSWLRESREKISQVVQELASWSPVERLLIHLLPPELAKSGAHLEVPIALACLVLCHGESLNEDQCAFLKAHRFVGALSLDGSLVHTKISQMVESACPQTIGPSSASTLKEIWSFVLQPETYALKRNTSIRTDAELSSLTPSPLVEGRYWERLLLLGASLAQVPVLLLGPPGVGKSHLARWAAGTRIPSTDPQDIEELRQIWSLAGLSMPSLNPLVTPQPRSHLSEFTGTVSSGNSRPGYFSLSHRGTLLVDEFTEVSRDCREILRFILDEKSFMRSSKSGNVIWPANFWFIATSNPCPCGFSIGEDLSKCRCTETARFAYRNRLSGPIWDRFGLKLFLDKKESKFAVESSLPSLLDAPVNEIHSTLKKNHDAYKENLKLTLGIIKESSGFESCSVRNQKLKAKLWSALSVIDPSRSLDEWGNLLMIHHLCEESWKG